MIAICLFWWKISITRIRAFDWTTHHLIHLSNWDILDCCQSHTQYCAVFKLKSSNIHLCIPLEFCRNWDQLRFKMDLNNQVSCCCCLLMMFICALVRNIGHICLTFAVSRQSTICQTKQGRTCQRISAILNKHRAFMVKPNHEIHVHITYHWVIDWRHNFVPKVLNN